MTGGHLGIKRTLDQVHRRAYWRGWRRDVRQFCRQCNECNSYFRGTLPRSAPLQRLQPMLTGEPFEKLHIDIAGPHPRSRRGSQWILTCVDPFLANVNSRSRSLYAIARPSVCRLSVVCLSSVTLLHPTQAVQIFRNISTAFGTLAIR